MRGSAIMLAGVLALQTEDVEPERAFLIASIRSSSRPWSAGFARLTVTNFLWCPAAAIGG
jgi:hypothetical protein